MTEKQEAIIKANKFMEEPNVDPDDDLVMMSRQFLRAQEVIEVQHRHLVELQDPMKDMVNANRDTILKKHEEAITMIRRCVDRAEADKSGMKYGMEAQILMIGRILTSLSAFHPMHGESWKGWPE